MTKAERIVLAIIRAETAAMGYCAFEGLEDRLSVYLDAEEVEVLMEGLDADEGLLNGFLLHLGVQNGVYICMHGFRYGRNASEPGIPV